MFSMFNPMSAVTSKSLNNLQSVKDSRICTAITGKFNGTGDILKVTKIRVVEPKTPKFRFTCWIKNYVCKDFNGWFDIYCNFKKSLHFE